ncbi:MAG: hypothetical protein QOJ76_1644, partial [Acidobacteriota bacterium]|nr:hypothetical protein [Acidobacteriota bacterium]
YFFTPPPQPRLFFNLSTYFLPENQTAQLHRSTISVRRFGYLIDSTVTVQFTTSDGTATAGSDYIDQTGTLTFAPGEAEKSIFLSVINDDIVEPDETVNLTLSNLTGNATLGSPSSATFTIENDDQYRIQFSAAGYNASEAAGSIPITVTLQGGIPSTPISVNYATSDGTAGERSDYITARGRLTFAPGETSKTFRILLVDDNLVEGDETVNLQLSNLTSTSAALRFPFTAQLTITDNDTTPPTTNPIDDAQFFVRQQYLDFLNREPDTSGFNFWTNQITSCGSNAQCIEQRRINVSAAFFLSIEFQRTGMLAYLTHKAAFGNSTLTGTPVPVLYGEFERDTQALQRNFVFGAPGADAQLEANKVDYFNNFVAAPDFSNNFAASPDFINKYPTTLTPAQYVDALYANAGITPTTAERNAAIAEFGAATNTTDQAARARALRRVAETPSFSTAEFNRSFVLMEYFGYLRRDADAAGYNFWLNKLNAFSGDFIKAEMVKAFISSSEYRQRFGP